MKTAACTYSYERPLRGGCIWEANEVLSAGIGTQMIALMRKGLRVISKAAWGPGLASSSTAGAVEASMMCLM